MDEQFSTTLEEWAEKHGTTQLGIAMLVVESTLGRKGKHKLSLDEARRISRILPSDLIVAATVLVLAKVS